MPSSHRWAILLLLNSKISVPIACAYDLTLKVTARAGLPLQSRDYRFGNGPRRSMPGKLFEHGLCLRSPVLSYDNFVEILLRRLEPKLISILFKRQKYLEWSTFIFFSMGNYFSLMIADNFATQRSPIPVPGKSCLSFTNTLGVDYNVHVLSSILRYVAPGLGWR